MPLLILVTLLSLKPNSLPTESFSINHPDITPIFYFISYSKTQLWRMTVLCCYLVAQLCLTLCDPIDCSMPDSSVLGISQARILEWVAVSFSRGIFLTRGLNPLLLCLLHWQVDSWPTVPPNLRQFLGDAAQIMGIFSLWYWMRGAFLVVQWLRMCLPMQGTQVWSQQATHSSILAWEIPWTEDPGGLQSMGLQKCQTWVNN